MNANFLVAQLDELPAIACPCGQARRAFVATATNPASIHWVQIEKDARRHYHKYLTEIYVVLEGQGHIEADGQLIPVKPLSTVLIRPGCRHRALGEMKLLNLVIPAFDPADEWLDEEG